MNPYQMKKKYKRIKSNEKNIFFHFFSIFFIRYFSVYFIGLFFHQSKNSIQVHMSTKHILMAPVNQLTGFTS